MSTASAMQRRDTLGAYALRHGSCGLARVEPEQAVATIAHDRCCETALSDGTGFGKSSRLRSTADRAASTAINSGTLSAGTNQSWA
jgi:hypothetical protein